MHNTIQDGQFVLVDRLTPRFDPYHRGDIVVFKPPNSVDERRPEAVHQAGDRGRRGHGRAARRGRSS